MDSCPPDIELELELEQEQEQAARAREEQPDGVACGVAAASHRADEVVGYYAKKLAETTDDAEVAILEAFTEKLGVDLVKVAIDKAVPVDVVKKFKYVRAILKNWTKKRHQNCGGC